MKSEEIDVSQWPLRVSTIRALAIETRVSQGKPDLTYSCEAGADEGLEREKCQREESKASHLERRGIGGEGRERSTRDKSKRSK
jgi:hypothetical protein